MDSFVEIFNAVKDYCRERVAPATYDLFITDRGPVSFEGGTVMLRVRSGFVKGVLEERYLSMLREGFKTLLGFEVEVSLQVAEAQTQPVAAASSPDYDYTFAHFIVGTNNKFAHAAAQTVAATPSLSWNPPFISGSPGPGPPPLLFSL